MAGPDKADATGREGVERGPRKPHGDKLGAATAAPVGSPGERPEAGDSPKRHGDPKADVVRSER